MDRAALVIAQFLTLGHDMDGLEAIQRAKDWSDEDLDRMLPELGLREWKKSKSEQLQGQVLPQNQLDRQNQVIVDEYRHSEESAQTQHEKLDKPARSGHKAGQELVSDPGDSGVASAKDVGGAYSIYWPGLHGDQLKHISEEARRLIAESDTLKQQLASNERIEIIFGPAEEGTYYVQRSKIIVIEEGKIGDTIGIVRNLAHEMGHATGPEVDFSSLESCLNSEGAAQINRIKIKNEIFAKSGINIGVGGHKENQPMYLYIYDLYVTGKISYLEAINLIGKIYGEKENPSPAPHLTYSEWYGLQGAR